MTSYWKLINLKTHRLILISNNENFIIDKKIEIENFFNTKTKIIKCFGYVNYKRDCEKFDRNINNKDYINEMIKLNNRDYQCKLQL